MPKAQSSAELLILIGAVLLIFSATFLAIQQNTQQKLEETKNKKILEIAEEIKTEINLAYESQDGYARTFQLPQLINKQEYQINITTNLLQIKTLTDKNSLAIPIKNVTGVPKEGNNTITKQNGTVKITQ